MMGSYNSISLDWAVCDIAFDAKDIHIVAEIRQPPSYQNSNGYLYRANLKWDPKGNWRREISDDAADWEIAQRDTPLWETVRGEDRNYSHTPWMQRPMLHKLVRFLKEQNQMRVAARIAEAYKLN